MVYMPLARKYRPRQLGELVGQQALLRTLKNALDTGKIHPAYIFAGIRGVGKTTVARIFAKGLNCEKGVTSEPCDSCASCKEIASGHSMDVLEIDGATHTQVDAYLPVASQACGLKIYVSDTFGSLRIDELGILHRLFRTWAEKADAVGYRSLANPGGIGPVAVHAEELMLPVCLALAHLYGVPLHIVRRQPVLLGAHEHLEVTPRQPRKPPQLLPTVRVELRTTGLQGPAHPPRHKRRQEPQQQQPSTRHSGERLFPHHQRRSDPTEFGFNVACLDDVNVFALGPIPVLDGVNHPADRRAVAALEASSTPQLRRLGPDDAEACVTLRQEMLREAPHTFGASPEQDLASDVARVRERLADVSGDASFGMFAPDLVGFVGLRRERALKMAHKASLWGMYVRPSMRGQGLGQGLVQAAIGHASTLAGVSHLHLSVSEAAPLALALYEAHGFTRWGTEPAALLVGDSLFDEHHMVLSIAVRPGD